VLSVKNIQKCKLVIVVESYIDINIPLETWESFRALVCFAIFVKCPLKLPFRPSRY